MVCDPVGFYARPVGLEFGLSGLIVKNCCMLAPDCVKDFFADNPMHIVESLHYL